MSLMEDADNRFTNHYLPINWQNISHHLSLLIISVVGGDGKHFLSSQLKLLALSNL